jgi:hypothetical protein
MYKEVPVSLIYEAIAEAETGSEEDPWIRTRHCPPGGSTAYGPCQLTKSLAAGYLQWKSRIFTPNEKEFLQNFVDQGELFAKYGNEPGILGYQKMYDYGGKGYLHTESDKVFYRAVVCKMLNEIYQRQGGDLEGTWKEWRFGPKGGTDERYREAFFEVIDGYHD